MAGRSAAVGARELKTRLGAYLRRVRDGRTLVITDRGEPVAELRPVERHATDTAARLARLAAKGSVTRHDPRPLERFDPIRVSRPRAASRLIDLGREDRF
ncbi:MAG: type II toxin-antitoxin system prevent-host-death family antitoxin [Acidobacteria bacterium]|nr:type II toxin-antitoxin system prevent-host-death family antitoxin [Acidobacteriota bacterium]